MPELSFDRLPPALPAFGKVALSRGARDGELAEPLVATAPRVTAPSAALRRYRKVCADRGSLYLPVCYPQVLALPLQLHLMGHESFPLPAMGLVHVSNRIEQQRPLATDEAFDVRVEIATIEKTERGFEFEMVTELRAADDTLAWRGIARILNRRGGGGKKKSPPPAPQPSGLPLLEEWSLKANLGRRYARASGDVNPIHLSALSAKLLGFKRAIIHGMWTQARAATVLPLATDTAGVLAVDFKTPLFLPGKARLHGELQGNIANFEVKDARNHKPILEGSWTRGEGA